MPLLQCCFLPTTDIQPRPRSGPICLSGVRSHKTGSHPRPHARSGLTKSRSRAGWLLLHGA
jgi:hypothetical protein